MNVVDVKKNISQKSQNIDNIASQLSSKKRQHAKRKIIEVMQRAIMSIKEKLKDAERDNLRLEKVIIDLGIEKR